MGYGINQTYVFYVGCFTKHAKMGEKTNIGYRHYEIIPLETRS